MFINCFLSNSKFLSMIAFLKILYLLRSSTQEIGKNDDETTTCKRQREGEHSSRMVPRRYERDGVSVVARERGGFKGLSAYISPGDSQDFGKAFVSVLSTYLWRSMSSALPSVISLIPSVYHKFTWTSYRHGYIPPGCFS